MTCMQIYLYWHYYGVLIGCQGELISFFVCIGLPRVSYWPYAFEVCGLEEDKGESFKYKHIN